MNTQAQALEYILTNAKYCNWAILEMMADGINSPKARALAATLLTNRGITSHTKCIISTFKSGTYNNLLIPFAKLMETYITNVIQAEEVEPQPEPRQSQPEQRQATSRYTSMALAALAAVTLAGALFTVHVQAERLDNLTYELRDTQTQLLITSNELLAANTKLDAIPEPVITAANVANELAEPANQASFLREFKRSALNLYNSTINYWTN